MVDGGANLWYKYGYLCWSYSSNYDDDPRPHGGKVDAASKPPVRAGRGRAAYSEDG